MTDYLHLRGVETDKPAAEVCEIHDWPSSVDSARALVQAMRERHGKGGINVCVDCIARLKAVVKPETP
jgi:hypothetical protein